MMSSHYKTKEPLSKELIEKIVKRYVLVFFPDRGLLLTHAPTHSRYVNVGLFYLRQLFFANFDLKVHTDKGTSHLPSGAASR
jgi:Zn-dependent oligopeptidase